jgi:hypothetical protein
MQHLGEENFLYALELLRHLGALGTESRNRLCLIALSAGRRACHAPSRARRRLI